jgi:lysophospholipase L1-like esterase
MMPRIRRTRLTVMVSAGVVVITGALCYIEFALRRPIGAGPAGPPVVAEAFAAPWTERRVHVVGIGDSITAGLGARSRSRSFFNRLIRTPDDDFAELHGAHLSAVLPNQTHENLAVSGSTSLHHVSAIRDGLASHDPDVFGLIVMTSGGNDLIHSYGQRPPCEGAMYGATLEQARPWIENFESRLESMLTAIEERFPGGCEIFLADIYDPTDGVGDAPSVYLPHWPDGLAIHAEYNRAIANVASRRDNVFIVPLYRSFLGHGSHCRQFWRSTYDASDPYYWYFDNIEDPNDRGHDAVRRVFLNAIAEQSQLANPQE